MAFVQATATFLGEGGSQWQLITLIALGFVLIWVGWLRKDLPDGPESDASDEPDSNETETAVFRLEDEDPDFPGLPRFDPTPIRSSAHPSSAEGNQPASETS